MPENCCFMKSVYQIVNYYGDCFSGAVVEIVSSEEHFFFSPWLGQINVTKVDICSFSAKHAAFRSKS